VSVSDLCWKCGLNSVGFMEAKLASGEWVGVCDKCPPHMIAEASMQEEANPIVHQVENDNGVGEEP
jgi:hypothetical protein